MQEPEWEQELGQVQGLLPELAFRRRVELPRPVLACRYRKECWRSSVYYFHSRLLMV